MPTWQASMAICKQSAIAARPVNEQVEWMAVWATQDESMSVSNRIRMLERFVCGAENQSMPLKLHPAAENAYAVYDMPGFHFGTLGNVSPPSNDDGSNNSTYAKLLWASSDYETQRGYWKSMVANLGKAANWIDAALAAAGDNEFATTASKDALAKARKWATTLVANAKAREVSPLPTLVDSAGKIVAPTGKRKRAPSIPRANKAATTIAKKTPQRPILNPLSSDDGDASTRIADLSGDSDDDGPLPDLRVSLKCETAVDGIRVIDVPDIAAGERKFIKKARKYLKRYESKRCDGFRIKLMVGDKVKASITME